MARIARCKTPLYVTRGRPFKFPTYVNTPSGAVLSLVGSSFSGVLKWAGHTQTISVVVTDAPAGKFEFSGTAQQTADMPKGQFSEIVVTYVDPLGSALDCVYPVVCEVP